jgi:K+-transporting ATPase ATPase A chain
VDPAGEVTEQSIALGPAASQVAIKMLGSNGGGFFSANSAHPFESPTPVANLVHIWAILALPVACCLAFGRLVGDLRQGRTLLAAMAVIWLPLLLAVYAAESAANPAMASLDIDFVAASDNPGGNMEGKEVRNGIAQSALFGAATTAVSNGAVNSMHDSYTPLGGLVPLWLILLGEVVFGGVGSGLYGVLMFAVVAVFVAGLMIGRTPEYLGKKIEAFEMQMASIAILLPSAAVLIGAAVAVSVTAGTSSVWNTGAPQGFSEILYAFASASNNNGSAFGGLGANTVFYNLALSVCMLVGRFGVILPVLAIAGSLAAKKTIPSSPGTLATHTPLFVVLLAGTVVLVGALTFLPALALGPIAQHLLWS